MAFQIKFNKSVVSFITQRLQNEKISQRLQSFRNKIEQQVLSETETKGLIQDAKKMAEIFRGTPQLAKLVEENLSSNDSDSKQEIEDQLMFSVQGVSIFKILVDDFFTERERDDFDEYIAEMNHHFQVFEPKDFADDPFLKNISIDEPVTVGSVTLQMKDLEPCHIIQYEEPSFLNGILLPHYGLFLERYPCPHLIRDGEDVATVYPLTIMTIDPVLEKAHGNVLCLGCDLGYFAYMAARKDDVTSVTVVDHDPDVLQIFKEHILPQFESEAAEKIKVIESDENCYLGEIEDGEYDFCFVDIWDDFLEFEDYFWFVKRCSYFKKMKIDIWGEFPLLTTLYPEMLSFITWKLYLFNLNKGIQPIPHIRFHPNEFSDIIKTLLKNEKVESAKDLERILDINYFNKLILKCKC